MRLQQTIILQPSSRQRRAIRRTLANFREGVKQIYRMGAEMGNFTQLQLAQKTFYRPTPFGIPYGLNNNLGLCSSYVHAAEKYVSDFTKLYPGEPSYRTVPMKLDDNTLKFIGPDRLMLETVEGPIEVKYRVGALKEAIQGTTRNQSWMPNARTIEIVYDPARLPPELPPFILEQMPTPSVPHRSAWLNPMLDKIWGINHPPDRSRWEQEQIWEAYGGKPYYQPAGGSTPSQVNPQLGGKWN